MFEYGWKHVSEFAYVSKNDGAKKQCDKKEKPGEKNYCKKVKLRKICQQNKVKINQKLLY
jgi:hypothetical protein